MRELFREKVLIHFHMADPAGIMFFANIFSLTHSTFESWVTKQTGGWQKWYNNSQWIVPLRQAQVDYLKPLRAGEVFEAVFSLKEVTESSFLMYVEFLKDGVTHVKLETRQVFCDKKTVTKIAIPADAKKILGI